MSKFDEINKATTSPVFTNVSPTLSSDSLLPFGKLLAETPHSGVYAAGRKAAQVLYEGLNDLQNAEMETRNRFGTSEVVDGKDIRREIPSERKTELAALMGSKFESVARKFDQHLTVINTAIDTLDSAIERTLANPRRNEVSTAQEASDIRKYVANLADDNRMNWLLKQVDEGDTQVIQACLAAPWPAGLNKQNAAFLKDNASRKFAPQEYAMRHFAQKLCDHLTASGKIFSTTYKKILPVAGESAFAKAQAKLKERA